MNIVVMLVLRSQSIQNPEKAIFCLVSNGLQSFVKTINKNFYIYLTHFVTESLLIIALQLTFIFL